MRAALGRRKGHMETERRLSRFRDLELWPLEELLEGLWTHSQKALAAVGWALPALAAAVREAALRLERGRGRLVYTGAGTSGRVAVQDGVELLPTFSWPKERLAFLLAGGEAALTGAVEGAEDDARAGRDGIRALVLGPEDVHVAVAASGTTPFTLAAQEAAREAGALTIALACNPDTPLLAGAHCPILLPTGAEALAGSTRLNAATAQKIALNLFSTALMVRLDRVAKGMMVALSPTSRKLRRRAVMILRELTGASEPACAEALERAGGDLRRALRHIAGRPPERECGSTPVQPERAARSSGRRRTR